MVGELSKKPQFLGGEGCIPQNVAVSLVSLKTGLAERGLAKVKWRLGPGQVWRGLEWWGENG